MEISSSIVQVRLSSKILALALTLISSGLYLSLFSAMPGFIDLYSSFGFELSLINDVIFSWYEVLLPISLIGLVPCAIVLLRRDLQVKVNMLVWRFVGINFVGSLILQAVIVYSLNAPIFAVGTTL